MDPVTEEEMDRLIGFAEGAYGKAMSGENIGLVAWTARVQTALKFIPTLVVIIEQLRKELANAQAQQGGHVDVHTDGITTFVTCSTCGLSHTVTPT